MTKLVYIEKDGAIASLIFNRSDKKNSLSLAMFREIKQQLVKLKEDTSIKVLIVRGVDDKAFSAGADITEFLEVRFEPEKAKAYNDIALDAIEELYRFPVPTIALIQTLAIGGGLELANSCDFRFATTNAKLGITASNVGIVYNLTSTKRLVNLVGPSKAKKLLFTAELIKAEEGLEIGLIDYVYEPTDIHDACLAFANRIIKQSPVANAGMKKVIQEIIDGENEESEEISEIILDSFQSEDYKEGIQAFLEKRKPQFK